MLSLVTPGSRKAASLLFLCGLFLCSNTFAQTGTWTALTHLPTHYNSGVMLLMTDGTVICKNSNGTGNGTGWDKLTPVNGSYVNGTWTSIASMAKDRLYFSSQVLPDGRVYVCGGEYGAGGKYGEVYNPATNTWTGTGGAGYVFPNVISDANSEILYDGRVLQASVDESGVNLNYLWNPTTNTYVAGPNCLRVDNEAVWVKLADSSIIFQDNYAQTSERYMPKTNTWINDATSPVELFDPYGEEAGAGFTLPDGRVFFIGSLPNTAYYTPSGTTAPGSWIAGPNIPSAYGAADAPSAMMPNGKILLTVSPTPTSANHFPSPTKYYEFDYTTNTFTQVGAPGGGTTTANSCYIGNMLDLPDGTVLFCNQGDDQYYVYTPGTGPLAVGKPTIGAVNRLNCDTFQVAGTLFNGITEGAAYGDDWQEETNYPIVRMTNGTNVYYATTYNWNRIGAVMTGALPDTAIFRLPAGLPAGTYSVTVIANGNPSDPFIINTSLAISPASLALCQGGTATLTDAATIGVWSSANSGIATIGSSTGLVTGVGVGTTTLSYSIGQCFATIVVTVNIGGGAMAGNLNVCPGGVTSLSDAVPGGTWSSSNGNATVDGSGNVTGVNAGTTATISYAPPAGCIATAVVTINSLPAATITPAGPVEFCTGGSVVLNANTGAGLTYQWQLGGGNIGGATLSSYTASTGGNYTVVEQNSAGCIASSATITVTVDTPPTATITPAGPTTFCTGGSVVLNANTGAGYTYQWQLGGGNIGGATTSSYTAALAGNYTVIVYSGACNTTSAITTVTITAGPGATITPESSTTFCPGGSVVLDANTGAGITYQWLLGGTGIPGATLASYTASAAGNYAVIVSQGACVVTSATTTVNILSLPTVTPVNGASSVCLGLATTLTDATAAGTWSSSAAGIASVDASGNVTGVSAGTAMISYTETNTCGAVSATFIMTVNTATVIAPITGNTTICIGQTSPLSDITPGGVWSSGAPGVAGVSAGGLVTGMSAGPAVINYTVTNAAGCVSNAFINVTIITPFTATITPASSTTFCTGGYVGLDATVGAGYTYQWQIGGSDIPGATTATYVASTGGIYTVIITNTSGCPSTSAGVTVVVNPSPIVIPTVNISGDLGTVLCATSASETFSATPTNGGAAPTYQWYVNGSSVGAGGTYVYTPANGDVVSVVMTSNDICAFPDTALGSLTMTISPLLTPSVSITSAHNDTTCTGDTVQFAAVPVYGGTAPTYLWTENSINVATGPYYIYAPHDGDTLVLTMQSNYPCLTTNIAISDTFIVHVLPHTLNSLSVSVSQSSVLAGSVDTFRAVATGAGASPAFQWYIDGIPVLGATSGMYITDSLKEGQMVSCGETSSFMCSEPDYILSGGIAVSVIAAGVMQVGNNTGNFTLVPNPNNGQFTIKGNVGSADDKATIAVTNVLGQSIYKKAVQATNGNINELISLDKSVAAGTYQVSVTSGENHVVFHVVIEK